MRLLGCPLRARSCYSQIVDAIGRPSHRADCDHDLLEAARACQTPCGPARSEDGRPGREHRRPRFRASRPAPRARSSWPTGSTGSAIGSPSTTASRSAISTSATSCRSVAPPSAWPKPPSAPDPAMSIRVFAARPPLSECLRPPRGVTKHSVGAMTSLRHRFPGVGTEWARFDGPGRHADGRLRHHGDERVDGQRQHRSQRRAVRRGRGMPAVDGPHPRSRSGSSSVRTPTAISFGPNMTSLTFAVSRAIGDDTSSRAIGSSAPRLDHDANITPWRRAADAAGAEHVLAPFDPATGTVAAGERDRAHRRAHQVGHGSRRLESARLDSRPCADHRGCARRRRRTCTSMPSTSHPIAGSTSPRSAAMRWSPRHTSGTARTADVLWMRPELLESLPVFKVRPATDTGPATARDGHAQLRGHRRHRGRRPLPHRRGHGSVGCGRGRGVLPPARGTAIDQRRERCGDHRRSTSRVPTAAFTIDGVHPADASKALAAAKIAVWDGHNYAVEVVDQLGLADSGGVIRAGVVALRRTTRRRPPPRGRPRTRPVAFLPSGMWRSW